RLVDDEVGHCRHGGSLRTLLDAVAEGDCSGLEDLAVYPERQMLVAGRVRRDLAIGADRPERVEVRLARFRVLCRNRATADVAAQAHEGRADADVSLDPAVLLMRLAAVQLEQHPEPPPVDGAVMATVTAELRERCRRDQRDLAA